MGLYEVPLLGFVMGGYVSQLPCVWYYRGNMLVRNASPRGPMCCA